MKKDMSYKLDECARLWMRSDESGWRLATAEESDRLYFSHPEFAAQAFWVADRTGDGAVLPLAA
ncbi:MAG: hypothetical protein MI741_24160 [Rhodospirillales bacterium]|nr:hypothetical protein [Rhodospirillales bacterium]